MKLYRGPTTKDFPDDTHQVVAEVDFSKNIEPWTGSKRIRANLSKEGFERSSVAHIELTSDDIIGLQAALTQGLQLKAKEALLQKRMLFETWFALNSIKNSAYLLGKSLTATENVGAVMGIGSATLVENIQSEITKLLSKLPNPHHQQLGTHA